MIQQLYSLVFYSKELKTYVYEKKTEALLIIAET